MFENATNLAACVSVIAEDPDVSVARIKNRLDPDYNSAPSAGYRSMSLNLRIVTGEARRMGIEAHVAEVQLLLRPFAELKVCVCVKGKESVHPCWHDGNAVYVNLDC